MVVDVVVDVVTLFLATSPPFYAPQGSDQDLCLLRCSVSYVFNSFARECQQHKKQAFYTDQFSLPRSISF